MRLFLIRHGLSEGNVDKTIHKTFPDHAIELDKKGFQQAEAARNFLEHYMSEKNIFPKARLWTSPYIRTSQTAEIIQKAIVYECPLFGPSIYEDITLCEQQFGLFDGLEDEELAIKYPAEFEHYAKAEKFQGRFWARMPLGESRFDVTLRVHQMFGTWKRDEEKHGITDVVVVTHGVTIRAITMRWLHKSVEWFESEPNPGNCSIRLIEDGVDYGYIFKGFDSKGKLIV